MPDQNIKQAHLFIGVTSSCTRGNIYFARGSRKFRIFHCDALQVHDYFGKKALDIADMYASVFKTYKPDG